MATRTKREEQSIVERFGVSVGDSVKPSEPPDFDLLYRHRLTSGELEALGCRPHGELDNRGGVLMLLPGEWYDKVPDEFELESMSEELVVFKHGETDSTTRLGVLGYGVRASVERHSCAFAGCTEPCLFGEYCGGCDRYTCDRHSPINPMRPHTVEEHWVFNPLDPFGDGADDVHNMRGSRDDVKVFKA